jgi:mono/diheme cytochrome c family protein
MNAPSLALCMSAVLSVSVAAGCATGSGDPGDPGSSQQVAAGASLFSAHCAGCHGALGQGSSKAPPVVGPTALPLYPRLGARLRTTQFRTAKDVLDFIRTKMPLDAPGSLREDEYEAILAFDLHASGMDLDGVEMSAATAPSFVLH